MARGDPQCVQDIPGVGRSDTEPRFSETSRPRTVSSRSDIPRFGTESWVEGTGWLDTG